MPPPQAMFQGVTKFFSGEKASRVTKQYAPQVMSCLVIPFISSQ